MTHEFVIEGRVQGVGFRSYVYGLATRYNLLGEVWNARDGTVHAIVQCDSAAVLQAFENDLHAGPGRVTGVRVQPGAVRNYSSFEVSASR